MVAVEAMSKPGWRSTVNVRRALYVPLIVSLIASVPLMCVAAAAIAAGWLRGILPGTTGHATTDVLIFFPRTFVICVSVCWLIAALVVPRASRSQIGEGASGRAPGAAEASGPRAHDVGKVPPRLSSESIAPAEGD
jgi:hypothetical protein